MRFKINPYNQSRKLVIGRILSIHTILVLFFPLIIAPRIQSFCSLKFVYRDFTSRQTTICYVYFNFHLLALRTRGIPRSKELGQFYTSEIFNVSAPFFVPLRSVQNGHPPDVLLPHLWYGSPFMIRYAR